MLILFINDAEIEVVESFDERTETLQTVNERIAAGQQLDVDVLDEYDDSVDIQFGDGSCAFSVPKSLIVMGGAAAGNK